ncbi:SDR family oxidoreductase [Rhizobium sp. ICMP 5592]|uniref:SDR family oxidoreductase n=1 Tax=Rhizobium sp. ICMP 5592 TaxID=2292445 RepID=UPI001296B713|nr:SDR family oxidoreductase [Rhizobium sp. ICMP 5592]MQB41796.1 SDR family NAD(P)-dependent oxidoreductase [Rhizobium sp. ICMP 5592]
MDRSRIKILVVGATGSIGRYVVEEALRERHGVRALVRSRGKLHLPPEVEVVAGDLTQPHTLPTAVDGIGAIVFTHGSHGGASAAEAIDYGGVRNILAALGDRRVRIALMTSIGVTDRREAHDWKRRAERLVRASGLPYTIVRPGWFDYNDANQFRLVLLQGDKRQSGTPRDGVIARRQLAEVLVRSLTSQEALRKTFELVAETGPAPNDFDRLFGALDADKVGSVDAVHDVTNMPLDQEPTPVVEELDNARVRVFSQ